MIVNMKNELIDAKKKGYAIPQFNVNNLEWAKYILKTCNLYRSPVIMGFTESAIEYMGGYHTASGLIYDLVHDLHITVPVSIHLDHGTSVLSCKKAIDACFTSVMLDASLKRIDTNIDMTNEVIEYARKKRVIVESEIGSIGKHDASDTKNASVTGSIIFVKKTKVDLLAPAVGNVHGIYKEFPNINVKLIKEISENTKMELMVQVFGYTPIFASIRDIVKNYRKTFNLKDTSKVNYIKHENDLYPIVNEKETVVYNSKVLNAIDEIEEYKKMNIKYFVINSFLIDDIKEVLKNFKTNTKFNYQNQGKGFLYEETIYKVKK